MRPQTLNPLFAAVTALPGIGPRLGRLVERVAGPSIVHLLWHLPTGVIDRRWRPTLAEAKPGRVVTLLVTVEGHLPGGSSRAPHRVQVKDGTGWLDLVYFHVQGDWLRRTFPVGEQRVVTGQLDEWRGGLQMTHPDAVGLPEEIDSIATVQPVYPQTAGLPGKTLARAIEAALGRLPDLAEWQDPAWLRRRDWPGWADALRRVHAPQGPEDLEPETPARSRLAFDELLAGQLALLLIRRSMRRRKGRSLAGDDRLVARLRAALPYRLTGSQEQALSEILADMAAPLRMLRLLQGDVGSGKTVVALVAMVRAAEAGTQSALLAPTEILARQHLETIGPLAAAAGLRVALLTGRTGARERRAVLEGLASGAIHILVGTHAILDEEVAFHDLGLVVIDEQHRFGVHQRLRLSDKGAAADVLVMTATPIPRTLAMTAYGDLDTSRLAEKPPGRRPVDTRALPMERLDELVEAIRRKLAEGAKVYWVCPLVEESETLDISAATERHAHLRQVFGDRVGLVHGRLKGREKDAAMAAFVDGPVDILIATTVIEVGVNVPAATVMVIEHAERYGLAQLHQLRGRVGRGDRPSSCLLLYQPPLTETARARIETLRRTEDGFEIAEEDLRLRGDGDLLGTRQSGMPAFRLADLSAHAELLQAARDDARLVLERDPELDSARGRALRVLLYLFEKDRSVALLRSG